MPLNSTHWSFKWYFHNSELGNTNNSAITLCYLHTIVSFNSWSGNITIFVRNSQYVYGTQWMSERLCSDYQPKYIFVISRLSSGSLDSKKQNTWNANHIQTTFGGGLKCNSNRISTDVSQSGRCGRSYRVVSFSLLELYTRRWHKIQRDRSAPERLRAELYGRQHR